jgi:hypothetical protein
MSLKTSKRANKDLSIYLFLEFSDIKGKLNPCGNKNPLSLTDKKREDKGKPSFINLRKKNDNEALLRLGLYYYIF